MVLKFKQRGTNDLKKVMIYGNDGTGKSTFAETYCHENNLHPIVIDIDDTNYTNLPILDLDFGTDIKTYQNIKNAIAEISKSGDFDTIIIDGVTSLLEMLVSKAKGLKKYSDRAERFQDLLRALLSSGKHLIFIGQADMEVIYNEEFQSSKMVIKVNSLVNEKYLCYKKKDGFSHKVVKFRTFEGDTIEAPEVRPEVQDNQIDQYPLGPIKHEGAPQLIDECIDALIERGRTPTVATVKLCIEDRCKDDNELQECIAWLENVGFGGDI